MDEITQPTFRIERRKNNEKIHIYPSDEDSLVATVEHHYDGFPAHGVVKHDVAEFEVIEAKFPSEDEDNEWLLDEFRLEVREFVERVLFTDEILTFTEVTVTRDAEHTYRIKEHTDGDEYVVALETQNERRIE